jgi:outer membrane protein assembly factor BamB
VTALAISPNFATDETIFAGTESGLFYSTNGARSWHGIEWPSGFSNVTALACLPDYATSGQVLVGTQDGYLFVLNSLMMEWRRLGESVITRPVVAIFVTRVAAGNANILVALDDALLISEDGGALWVKRSCGLPDDYVISAVAAPLGPHATAPVFVGSIGQGFIHCE